MSMQTTHFDQQKTIAPALKAALSSRFNKHAHEYDKHAVVQKQIAEYALSILSSKFDKPSSNSVLLDLGCGTSNYLHQLGQFANTTIGIDVSHNMLRQSLVKSHATSFAQKRLAQKQQSASFLNADAEQLPIATNSINTVFSSMALQWCMSPEKVMSELNRVLMPMGQGTLAILIDKSFASLHDAYQQIGIQSRLNRFYSVSDWLETANVHSWSIEHELKTFYTQHPSVIDMLRSIKKVGAGTKQYKPNNNAGVTQPTMNVSKNELNVLTDILTSQKTVDLNSADKAEALVDVSAKTSIKPSFNPLVFSLEYVVLFLNIKNNNSE